jgi:hypothetical protein
MITSMHIENFKCFKEFDIELGPNLNVLIGPNDTGKTAFLQAIRLCGYMGERLNWDAPAPPIEQELGISTGRECVWRNDEGLRISMIAGASGFRDASLGAHRLVVSFGGGGARAFVARAKNTQVILPDGNARPWFAEGIGEVRYYRLDPKALRIPRPLNHAMDGIGDGLPVFLDSINRESRKVFFELESTFYERFPYYRQITLPNKGNNLSIAFETVNGEKLGCESVSDGVMLSLAFMAIAHQPNPPRVLLIEEPENGVHHASLKDIVETLKQLSKDKGVQVIMTTHSPYLLDEVDFSTVHVFQKDPEGAVHAKKLSDFEGAGEISDMFSTGEKWSLLAEKYGI